MMAMQTASLTRRYRFAAAHRLHSDQLSAEENHALFGPCNNPNGHGHNYVLLVTVRGPIDSKTGRAVDVEALDRLVHETIVARFDHQDLNQDSELGSRPTTGENLVRFFWHLLATRVPQGRLEKVSLIETRDNYFEYAEPIGDATPSPSDRGKIRKVG
jgi:6-pyruvoyltetrahydropterin/6-carboxytetrahydropterin synthase